MHAGEEGIATGRAALLGVVVREDRAFVADAIDVGRLADHQAAVVDARLVSRPMSSPMMKRILGFCAGCAVAGVLAGPDSDINIVAPSSEAQDLLWQLDVLNGGIAAKVACH